METSMIHDVTERLAYGELVNSQRNSTYGWLRMIGSHSSTVLQLTGNAGSALFGRHIEFETQMDHRDRTSERRKTPPIRHYQVGPIGSSRLEISGQTSSGAETGFLSLEWFGQDGHIRIDRLPVEFRYVSETSHIDTLACEDLAFDDPSPWRTLAELPAFEPVDIGSTQFSNFLDEMCSGECDTRIADTLQPIMQVCRAGELDDREVVVQLKSVLANLARHGITLDMCEHFSARQAYALLVDHLLQEELTYANLPSVGYVQHLMTHEHCEHCARELDEMLDEL
jgi:hypothetical protein